MKKLSFEGSDLRERPGLSSLFIITGILLVAYAVANILAAVIMILVSGAGVQDLGDINRAILQSSDGWLAMMLGQGVASLLTFIGAGLFYWYIIEKKKFDDFNFSPLPASAVFLIVFLIQLSLLPFNGWVQHINENMKLPAFLADLEKTLKSLEESLAEVTKMMTTFDSIPRLVLALLVIGVIAGIGEELIFRGLVQRKLQLWLRNPHAAIWLSAIFFSAFHMQFYGFLPRLVLGGMFGYFYYWTGNLWVPVAAHIFNNCFAVIMIYLVHIGVISPEIEKMDQVPVYAIILSLAAASGFIWLLRKKTT